MSFLPDFCVPYKHFGTDVIEAVLAAVLLWNLSVRAAARWDSVCNTAGFSRTCAGEWLAHFRRNSHNLWHFGLARLGVVVAGEGRSCAALLVHLRGFGAGEAGCAEHRLRAVQCVLSGQYPPFGLFRAQLLPGCFTLHGRGISTAAGHSAGGVCLDGVFSCLFYGFMAVIEMMGCEGVDFSHFLLRL